VSYLFDGSFGYSETEVPRSRDLGKNKYLKFPVEFPMKGPIQFHQSFPKVITGMGGVISKRLDESNRTRELLLCEVFETQKLTQIPPNVLLEMVRAAPQLNRLQLCHNFLANVPEELVHFTNLETLELSHNCIKKIPEVLVQLAKSSRLKNLALGDNHLHEDSFPNGFFPSFQTLQVLELQSNQFRQIPKELPQINPETLIRLDLSHNELLELPKGKFVALINDDRLLEVDIAAIFAFTESFELIFNFLFL
jgi:Leucine-rich repeat (LRR) protein